MRFPFLSGPRLFRSADPEVRFLVVGLGNPGDEYAATRHNVGFRVVDLLADRRRIDTRCLRFRARVGWGRVSEVPVALVKPQTYMNLSGESVRPLMDRYALTPAQVLVITDDIELAVGRLRVRSRGSAGGHNGLKSLIHCLETDEFPRIRVGVGKPAPGTSLIDHVLGAFSPEESEALAAALERAVEAVELVLSEGVEPAMNRFNAG